MGDPIAIVGLSARLPGDGDSPEAFFASLLAGRSARTEVPPERYNGDAFWHPHAGRSGSTRARHGHFLKGSIAAFDAPFFSITPNEARSIDPQQRGIMECVYKAIENAGIPMQSIAGSQTGVYVGSFTSDYNDMTVKDLELPNQYSALGTVASMLSNRVSWFFDFRGPSLTIDTACSSSLVAVHEACMSLKMREISTAIVGGCNLILTPEMTLKLDAAGVLGPDGKSQSFDHRANGYARGEGFGVLVLKRVSDAIRDGDVIRAVIRNSSTNQDGRSPGITQPTKAAQAALIRHVYYRAGLDPSLTRFFEAHGTGTAVGDPIEASAIADVFAPHRSLESPLYVGALKSNVGHLEGAAGVAAVIKGVLALESGMIPGNYWFEKKNPKIQDSWNLKFPTEPTDWPQQGLRRMSINSFGVGGSNAHVVLDDALHFLRGHRLVGNHRTAGVPRNPTQPTTLTNGTNGNCNGSVVHSHRSQDSGVNLSQPVTPVEEAVKRLFVFSAHDQDGVTRVRDSYKDFLRKRQRQELSESGEAQFLDDLSFTLASRRTHHSWRSFGVASSQADLQDALEQIPLPIRAKSEPRLAFVFTGQGAQWPTMGIELMSYPIFKESLLAADRYLCNLGCSWSLLFELSKEKTMSNIANPELCQPICTALQIALLDLLDHWGIYPHAVTGHSSGEIAAAYAFGAISREAAWKVAYYRGKMSANLIDSDSETKLGMAAVGQDTTATQASIDRVLKQHPTGSLEIACYNSPESHTVSGDVASLNALVEMLSKENVFARKLNVELAYHSHYMKAVADDYLQAMDELESGHHKGPVKPRFFSSTVGSIISPVELQDPSYWVRNLVSPVRFCESVTTMLAGSGKPKTNGVGLSNGINGVNGTNGHAIQQCDDEPLGAITDFLEIGPHGALKGPLANIAKKVLTGANKTIDYHTMIKRYTSGSATAIEAAASLFCHGYNVDLGRVNVPHDSASRKPLMLTNLPSYPFNHSKEYWAESKTSRDFRLRPLGRHELLGVRVPGWHKYNAAWRNYIRISENPWIEDHKVVGDTLYPAAGMLVMAIEASRQLADPEKILRGFRFKDVSFRLALRVPDDDRGVESYVYVRPHREGTLAAESEWNVFELWTVQDEEWREHCRGFVRTEYAADLLGQTSLQDEMVELNCAAQVKTGENTCTRDISVEKLYRNFEGSGLDFGSSFRTLSNVRFGQDLDIIATVDASENLIKEVMPQNYIQPHLVHPATLDGIIHANLAPLASSNKHTNATRVPTFASELWVSADLEALRDNYKVAAQSQIQNRNEVQASVSAVQSTSGKPVVYGSGLVFTTLPGGVSETSPDASKYPAYTMTWKPDPTMLSSEDALRAFGIPMAPGDDPSAWMEDCEALCILYMRRCLSSFSPDDIDKAEWHHKRYLSWFKHVVADSTKEVSEDQIAELETKVCAGKSAEGKLIMAVGRALSDILSGQRDPLDVIFKDQLAEEVYRDGLGSRRCYEQLCNYLDALAHKNPNMQILEIGAGTGGATRPVMATLTQQGRRYKHYEFTDISPSFFERAKETFQKEAGHMSFRVLNVESDPSTQGFTEGNYDLIIAANVLHATKNIDNTLTNTRKLLKPSGKLLLFEITNPTVLLGSFCFGVLPGWWLSEDKDRVWGPLMSPEPWRMHLTNSGFNGLDVVFDDFSGSAHQMSSIMVSSACEPDTASKPTRPPTYILVDETNKLQMVVAQALAESFTDEKCDIFSVTSATSREWASDASVVVLAELHGTLLKDMTHETFESIKHILSHCKTLVWLTNSESCEVPDPSTELVTGLARVARSENPSLNFATVWFGGLTTASSIVKYCLKVLRKDPSDSENSFRVTSKVTYVPRLTQYKSMTEHIEAHTGVLDTTKIQLTDDIALSCQIGTPGNLETLRFEDSPYLHEPLDEHDVEFKVQASGLNLHDVSTALGKNEGFPLGFEASGIVTRVGASSKFAVGDRVFGLSLTGTVKTLTRSADTLLAKLPDSVSWSKGATIPVAYTTAYTILFETGTLPKAGKVLVHTGCSPLGRALIQLSQFQGFEVFTTVNTVEERASLETAFGLSQDHILPKNSVKPTIHRLTNGRGVDIAINTAEHGDSFSEFPNYVAPFGRVVHASCGENPSSVQIPPRCNIRFESFDLTCAATFNTEMIKNSFQKLTGLLSEDMMDGISDTTVITHSFSDIGEAFRDVQSRGQTCRILLERRNGDAIPVLPSRSHKVQLNPDVTYVIAGGLGGLGQSISRWMASQGAKNLVLLSRRGPVLESAKTLIKDLVSKGCCVVTPLCDVTDAESLSKTLADCSLTLPPIKGCIQGSMVLKDNRLQNMPVEDWNAAIRPKVHASLNLSDAFGKDVDFFIMLSSTVGLTGNPEQANYAAGGTFQDALATHLKSKGVNAASIDLPMIRGIGYVAEKPELWDYLQATGWTYITEDELHAVLDYHCQPAKCVQDSKHAQVIPRLWLPQQTASEGYQVQAWGEEAIFSHLCQPEDNTTSQVKSNTDVDHKALLTGAASRAEAEQVVLDALLHKISRMLSVEVSQLDVAKPLHAYGIDSLVAVELRSWLAKELGSEASVFDIMSNGSLAQLAATATDKSRLKPNFGTGEGTA